MRYLQSALNSARCQTYANLEIVVSDNASTDGTAALLASFADPRIKLLRQASTLSMVANWNACLRAATGEYFLLLSDDDLLEPEAIERLVGAFAGAPNVDRVGIVYGGGRVIDAEGNLVRLGQTSPPEESASDMVLGLLNSKRDAWPCSILFRRSDMDSGYSPDFLLITDAAMWVQAVARHGLALFVDQVLVSYRAHQNLTSTTQTAVWQRESANFVAFAIRCLEAAGQAQPERIREIRKALARHNARLAVYMPLNRADRKTAELLREYWRQRPQLASFYGASLLVRGLLALCLPRSIKAAIKEFRAADQA